MTSKAYITMVMNTLTCCTSHGRRGGHFCCRFGANLSRYLLTKNYQHKVRVDKISQK